MTIALKVFLSSDYTDTSELISIIPQLFVLEILLSFDSLHLCKNQFALLKKQNAFKMLSVQSLIILI